MSGDQVAGVGGWGLGNGPDFSDSPGPAQGTFAYDGDELIDHNGTAYALWYRYLAIGQKYSRAQVLEKIPLIYKNYPELMKIALREFGG